MPGESKPVRGTPSGGWAAGTGSRRLPTTSRSSTRASRAERSIRCKAADVCSPAGSRAAPADCTTTAPSRCASDVTTPAAMRLRSSSRVARTCAARCCWRIAVSLRSSRTWFLRAMITAPASAVPPNSTTKKKRSLATLYSPASVTWLAPVSRAAPAKQAIEAATGVSQAPARNPAPAAPSVTAGVSTRWPPASASTSAPPVMRATSPPATGARRCSIGSHRMTGD